MELARVKVYCKVNTVTIIITKCFNSFTLGVVLSQTVLSDCKLQYCMCYVAFVLLFK